MEGLLTLREAGAYLCLSERSVRKYVWSGDLAYYRLGRRLCFRLEDLERFVESRRCVPFFRRDRE